MARRDWARIWFASNALVVLVGLAIQLPVAMNNDNGYFDTPLKRGLNTFVFFTVQSNIIVGVTSFLLALRLHHPSLVFRVFRLIGVVGIALTFIVFHTLLRDLQDLTGEAAVADFLLHTMSPILCVLGWLVFGPRGQTSTRVVWWALAFLIAWGAFTLVRGALIDWYPYPFMDPIDKGYARVAVNLTLIGAVFLGLSAGAHWLDGVLARRQAGGVAVSGSGA